ncbi:MAG: hypothetical protein ABS92_01680 [Thiobacillus sp. SCN 63-374]|nr:MAG: hypothetical protein ABS92_01680 [Thiobacillus sp. SCN 63-374]
MAKLCDVARFDDSLFRAGAVFKPDGNLKFASRSGKTKGEIQFKQVGNEWIAEYRYRFRCGGFHGHTIPLSAFSQGKVSREEAIEGAAFRMLKDAVARCGDTSLLVAVQRKELTELLNWVKARIVQEEKPASALQT